MCMRVVGEPTNGPTQNNAIAPPTTACAQTRLIDLPIRTHSRSDDHRLLRGTASFTRGRPAVDASPSQFFSKGVYSRVSIHGMSTLQHAICPTNDLGKRSTHSHSHSHSRGQQRKQQPHHGTTANGETGPLPLNGADSSTNGFANINNREQDGATQDDGHAAGEEKTSREMKTKKKKKKKKKQPPSPMFGVRVTKKSAFKVKEPVREKILRERGRVVVLNHRGHGQRVRSAPPVRG